LEFSYKDSDDHINNDNNNDYDGNSNNKSNSNIIILKKVKSVRQLRNHEKEWVRLCYKEAVLKGFTMMNDIQYYIASKTKIWIERSGIEYLKKSEEEENRKWYYYMAKDHFAYVGAYRKAVDEVEQYKRELWKMLEDKKTTQSERIQISKELHSLTKTYTLLLRDLPFISNLTNYYDIGFFTSNRDNSSAENNSDDNNNDVDLKSMIDFNSKRELSREERMDSGLFLEEFDPERGKNSYPKPIPDKLPKSTDEDNFKIEKSNSDNDKDSITISGKEKGVVVEGKDNNNHYNDNIRNETTQQTIKHYKKKTDKINEDMRRQFSGNTKPLEEMLKDKDFVQTLKNIRELNEDL
jgi:hypothetical protein